MHFIYWGWEWISCYLFKIIFCVHTFDVNFVMSAVIHLFVSAVITLTFLYLFNANHSMFVTIKVTWYPRKNSLKIIVFAAF